MQPERWKRIEELFHRAAEAAGEDRTRLLEEECGDDAGLRGEIEALLEARSGTLFRTPALDRVAREMSKDQTTMEEGQQLGSYTVVSLLGRGGMGEVYRARDNHLGRDVALKVLPTSFALDPDRVARFGREARLLAALNHPNIATIHGLEETGGTQFLVLELIEGPTLEERLEGGPIRVDLALEIALQIATSLEAAHLKGIIHRDLKPANIKITPDGRVKILDFGLAKSFIGNPANVSLSDTPTVSMGATQAGFVLGTPAYMSPEQAEGHDTDGRADNWAFGCILYEMLTGRRAFEGESVADILSRVLRSEPDWSQLPASVPPSVRHLLRLCLEKDPGRRRQAAGDIRIDLENAMAAPPGENAATPPGHPSRVSLLGWAAAAVVALALGIPALMHLGETAPAELRLELATPPTFSSTQFALSPDGKSMTFVASDPSTHMARLYLRPLDAGTAQPLPGTEYARHPFWSPDSRWIGFFASGQLKRIDTLGGPPETLAPAANPNGGSWSGDGTIIFGPNAVSPLYRVPASGGEEAVPVTALAPDQVVQIQSYPFFLPDSRQFLFYVNFDPDGPGIYLGSLDGGASVRLTAADGPGVFLPPDRIVFLQGEDLVARELDATRGELRGDPVVVAAGIRSAAAPTIGLSASETGIIAYRSSPPDVPAWLDRTGEVLEPGMGGTPELSPDERYVAYQFGVAGESRDVWIEDRRRAGSFTPFTRNPLTDGFPLWDPNGSRIAWHSDRNGTFDIWIRRFNAGNAPEELLYGTPDANEWPLDWSLDGRFVLYVSSDGDYAHRDLWALPMTGTDREPVAVATTAYEEAMGEFSPDSAWIAYQTNESGQLEIWAQKFPEADQRVQVSTGGGSEPRWSPDRSEIFFLAYDGTMMAAPVTVTDGVLEVDAPVPLPLPPIAANTFKMSYAVSRDGRFLAPIQPEVTQPISVLLNWKP